MERSKSKLYSRRIWNRVSVVKRSIGTTVGVEIYGVNTTPLPIELYHHESFVLGTGTGAALSSPLDYPN